MVFCFMVFCSMPMQAYRLLLRRSLPHHVLVLGCLGVLGGLPCVQAQDSATYAPRIRSVGVTGYGGFIFVHSQNVENTRGARPLGVQVAWVSQRTDADVWNTCTCYPRQGWLLGYYNYDNAVLGHSAKAAYFLEPTFRFTSRLSVGVRGTSGLAYLSRPYHPTRNPQNQSYSLPVSVYVGLGAGLHYQLTPRYRINVQAAYEHISNGGLKEPNKGINYPMLGVGLEYAPRPVPIPVRTRALRRPPGGAYLWQAEGYAFGSSRTAGAGQQRRFGIFGAGVLVRRQVTPLHAFHAGAEGYWDFSARERMRQEGIVGLSHFRAGLLAGHDFVLGRFTFRQQLGVYIFDQMPYYTRLYHRWGLAYHFNERWGLGFSLKAHRHVANFADVRLVWRW